MTQARGYGLNAGKVYTNVVTPKDTWCNFIVDSTNGNGLGTRSLKSNGYIEAVFMHTSATPGLSPGGFTNPNPPAGYAVVVFKQGYNYYLGGTSGQIVPLTSPSTTSVTANNVYVLTSLGTATTAQLDGYGIPPGFTPAVGAAFVASQTGTMPGSSTVGLPGVPKTLVVTAVGDPNTTIGNSNVGANAGAQMILQLAAATDADTTTLVAAAPTNETVIGLSFSHDGSTVTIDGL